MAQQTEQDIDNHGLRVLAASIALADDADKLAAWTLNANDELTDDETA